MKLLHILLSGSTLLAGMPAEAHHYHYNEPYVIGRWHYYNDYDRHTCTKQRVDVTSWSDGTKMEDFAREPMWSCIESKRRHTHHHHHTPVRPAPTPREPSPDGNECIEGSVLGGIAGGGLGAALSRGEGRWWAIPTGIVLGSVVGCDIDGG